MLLRGPYGHHMNQPSIVRAAEDPGGYWILGRQRIQGDIGYWGDRDLLQRLTFHEEPMPTLHVVPKSTVATKARADDRDLTA